MVSSHLRVYSRHIHLQLRNCKSLLRHVTKFVSVDNSCCLQIALAGSIGLGFKIFGKTPFRRSADVDLSTDLEFFEALDDHYRTEEQAHPKNLPERIMARVF